MKNSYRFFENKDCKYYPCHTGLAEMNCLFCFCPLYAAENCPGTPEYRERNGHRLKICTNCIFPHRPENYVNIMQILKERMR